MSTDVPTISSFKELLNEISWSWEYPRYDIEKVGEDCYCLNKLYIERDRVSYKTDNWILVDGVFEQFEQFVKFLKNSERI